MKAQKHKFKLTLVAAMSRLVLLYEQVLALVFPAILLPLVFLAFALLGLFDVLGDPWRLGVLIATLVGALWFLWQRAKHLNWPGAAQTRARMEADSGLRPGTFASLQDQPIARQKDANTLWQAHLKQALRETGKARTRLPKNIWTVRDPFAVRVGVFLLLVFGAVFAGSNGPARLENALYPGWLDAGNTQTRVEAWLNAPGYTDLPPRFLQDLESGEIHGLPGSELLLRVTGTRRAPLLKYGVKKPYKAPMKKLGDRAYEQRLVLERAGPLSLSRGLRTEWKFTPLEDHPPAIDFVGTPEANELDELDMEVLASDDYGVEKIYLTLATTSPGFFDKKDEIQLTLPTGKKLQQKLSIDLTRHVFAALPVTLGLKAVDGAGQETRSKTIHTILPSKLFIDPWAMAIAEQRHLLMRDTREFAPHAEKEPSQKATKIWLGENELITTGRLARIKRAPDGVRRATHLQRALMRVPEQAIEDKMVWLGLVYVQGKLLGAREQKAIAGLPAEMWALALRAEGGELESAAAALKQVEKALQNALLLGAPPSELARLSKKYDMAVKRYLKALADEAAQDDGQESAGGGQNLSGEMLQEMLKALQELAETGATRDARALLKALSEMLQNLRMQMANGGQGAAGDDPVSEAMREALEELGKMMGEQRQLMDDAQQQQNQNTGAQGEGGSAQGNPANGASAGGQAGQNQNGSSSLSVRQGALGQQLKELGQGQSGAGTDAKSALNGASDAMQRAAEAYGEGDTPTALEEGGAAIGQLRDGAEKLANDMLDRAQGAEDRGKRDPFGRNSNSGSQSGDGTDVPDTIDPERARKILLELRKRAAEQNRDRQELDYLDRLLERF